MTTLDVKQAVEIATKYFFTLMTVDDVRLEEVELSDDERFWSITLSGLVRAQKPPTPALNEGLGSVTDLAKLFGPGVERVYRVFSVDCSTGAVRSMKIRTFA